MTRRQPYRPPNVTLWGSFESRWRLEAHKLSVVEKRLGPGVLAAFCRSFVHADRLTSLGQFALWNLQQTSADSVAQFRNRITVVWFSLGTLRELALAVRDLRSGYERQGWSTADLPQFARLREIERVWDDSPSYRRLRDRAAFHVDRDVMTTGIERLRPMPVTLAEGDGGTTHQTSMTLGADVMVNGLGMAGPDITHAFELVQRHHKCYMPLQELFVAALTRTNVRFQQRPWE